jgi:hypothetical protein
MQIPDLAQWYTLVPAAPLEAKVGGAQEFKANLSYIAMLYLFKIRMEILRLPKSRPSKSLALGSLTSPRDSD